MTFTTGKSALSYSNALTNPTPPPAPIAPAPIAAEVTSNELTTDEGDDSRSSTDVVTWVLENRDAIVALHSSPVYTSVFELDCTFCDRFYKHCMFSKAQRKSDNPRCRWCMHGIDIGEQDREPFEITQQDRNEFEINLHIHCNRPGKKVCRAVQRPYSLDQVEKQLVVEKEESINDIEAKAPAYVVKTKMSQKERKAADRAAMGL